MATQFTLQNPGCTCLRRSLRAIVSRLSNYVWATYFCHPLHRICTLQTANNIRDMKTYNKYSTPLDCNHTNFIRQSSGNSSRILEINVLLSISQRLKNRPAKPIKEVGSSGVIISTFSSATYRMLVSSTLEVLLVSFHFDSSRRCTYRAW